MELEIIILSKKKKKPPNPSITCFCSNVESGHKIMMMMIMSQGCKRRTEEETVGEGRRKREATGGMKKIKVC
jgi:hypothetical protein